MKPLLVLVLVLAAIAGLLFTVMNVGGKKSPSPIDTTVVTQPNTPEKTKDPTVLDPVKGTGRTSEVPKGAVNDPNLPTTTAIVYDNKLTGVVKNDRNEPIAGAEVHLTVYLADDLPFIDVPVPDMANEPRVRTDSDGRYAFVGIEPRAKYGIIASHPEYASKRESSMPVGESGVIEQAPIILSKGGQLTGYVYDEARNVIPDATLFLDGENYISINNQVPPDRITTKTNKEGWFSFVNISPGQRTVGVSAPGYGKIQVGGFTFSKDEQYTRDFTLKLAEMICGRVVGAGNEPVVEANVIAVGVSHTQQSGMVTTKSNAQGEFCFENLVPGEYNVIANAKGWRMVPGRNTTRLKSNTSNVVIEMMREATISGVVLDAATGAPVVSCSVRLRHYNGDGVPTSATSADYQTVNHPKGEFTLETPGPSDYVVEATAAGYAPSFSAPATVEPGKSVNNLIVRLGRGGTIQGRVVDPEGKPIARARVMTQDNTWTDDEFTRAIGIQFPTNATTVDVRTDDAGRFTCTGLKPETYQLVITAAGHTTFNKQNFQVSEGVVTQAGDLQMARGGTVRGTLFDASGKPVANGTVRLRAIDNTVYVPTMSTRTGGDGKFVINNCPPGRFTLSGMRSGGSEGNPFAELLDANSSQVNVIVAEGDVSTQDLRLQD